MVSRRGAAVALSSLVLVGSSLVWAPAGQADAVGHGGSIGCAGASVSTYDPPLTLVPRETHVRTQARYTCTVGPGRTVSATGFLEGVSPAASCVALTSSRLNETVRYADGGRSVIGYDRSTTLRVAGVLVIRLSGSVSEGRGAGQSAQRTVAALPGQLPTQCLLSGLRGSNGQAQLEIQP
ncbi:hypothetical protein JIX56_36335 [Streptomyces sp. CA-210063]|uniref:hypothetical protein n=1 Tax=Streptomyces sp. CA-210063 TaxID=2801029 RepID=UPI00214CFDE2|nr:hypothetical protein [Streptomyces sp. CA-210063]UUU34889.1 hypothetical protein JIX56_36335 [Streptomyces sp. CA-210063]